MRGYKPKLTKEHSQTLTITPDTSFLKEGRDESTITAKDVSRVIAEVISLNTENPVYKKNLFEPPLVANKNKPPLLPKLRVVKANAVVPWVQPGQTLNLPESIDNQRTRVSFSTNAKLDVSTQYEHGLANNFLQNSMEQQSGFPLTQNESFMREDNAGRLSARENVQNAY